jgi:hypothetical protein
VPPEVAPHGIHDQDGPIYVGVDVTGTLNYA